MDWEELTFGSIEEKTNSIRAAKCWRKCKSRQRVSLLRAMRTVSSAYSTSVSGCVNEEIQGV